MAAFLASRYVIAENIRRDPFTGITGTSVAQRWRTTREAVERFIRIGTIQSETKIDNLCLSNGTAST